MTTISVCDPAMVDGVPGTIVRVYRSGTVQITLQSGTQWYGKVERDNRGYWVAVGRGTSRSFWRLP